MQQLTNSHNINHFLEGIELSDDNIHHYIELLNHANSADIATAIGVRDQKERLLIFNSLSESKAVTVFEYLPFKIQKEMLKSLPTQQMANLLNAVAPDDRTTFLEELPENQLNQLLKYLSPEERAVSIKLLKYPENSVGRLMTPDYIAIKMYWTVRQTLDYIRAYGKYSETVNVIYATNDEGVLVDDFRIREFLFASLDTKVQDLADSKYIALNVFDNVEKAVNIFRKYDRIALPVVDPKGILLGIVTIDDIMKIATQEDTEDIQKIGGVTALNEPYMDISFLSLMQKRIGWLTILFVGEMFTATAMGYFEEEISRAVVLALFLPLIISSGGNAGSQASTLIIRALALGEITVKDWWKIMHREIYSGLFLGLSLGLIGFFRVSIWSMFSNIYGAHWILVATTVFFSLIGVVLWGTFSGAMLPLLLKKCGFDPATSSAPFVATLVDVTGIVIYFSIAMIIFKGTLL